MRYARADRLPAGITRMRCLPAVLGFGSPPRLRARLIFQPAVELPTRMPGGEHVDPAVSRLLASGCTLFRDAGQMPASASGWHLRPALGRAALQGSGNTVVYRGTCRLLPICYRTSYAGYSVLVHEG